MSVKISCSAGGNGKWYNYFRKQFGSLLIRDIRVMMRLLGMMDMLTIWIVLMNSYVFTYIKTIKLYTSYMYSLPNQAVEKKALLQEKNT